MNSNYNLELEAIAYAEDKKVTIKFDPYSDCADMEELRTLLATEWASEYDDEDMPADVNIEITDFGGVPEAYANDKEVWKFAEAFACCEQEEEVVVAALECGVDATSIDEAYQGSFSSDEKFAEDMADQLGSVDKNATWPMNCIDWEHAARELMMDYSDHNGHYFRN